MKCMGLGNWNRQVVRQEIENETLTAMSRHTTFSNQHLSLYYHQSVSENGYVVRVRVHIWKKKTIGDSKKIYNIACARSLTSTNKASTF